MISTQALDQVLQRAKELKALVIGDAMLDKYIYGSVDRISPEAPVPVVTHHRTEVKSGGAANVALNLAAWGCHTTLIGLTGKDANAALLTSLLEKRGIAHHLYQSEHRPTTVKTRVVAASHHLLRIDDESTAYLSGEEEKMVKKHILDFIQAEKPDLIILEDYNKGLLTPDIIAGIIGQAKAQGIYTAVDPKEKNYFEFKGVDLFKPNLREASQAAHQPLRPDQLSEICHKWRKALDISSIAITLGAHGLFLKDESQEAHVLPSRAIDVVDVCGAGDAVICALALSGICHLDLNQAGALANLTGAYVCSHSGVVTVDVKVIHQWIS